MHIKKIWVKDFRTIRDGVLDLGDGRGMYVIIANNGTGKSTYQKACELLLTNDGMSLENGINWDADSFSIGMEFDHNNINYKTEMDYSKKGKTGTSERRLWEGNLDESEPTISGVTEVKDYLSNLFDPKLLSNSLFFKQGAHQIIECQDSERREILKKLKDLDYSKLVAEHILPEILKVEKLIDETEKEIYRLENTVFEEKDEIELPFTSIEYDAKRQKVEDLQKQKEILQKDLDMLDEYTRQKTSLSNEINDFSSQATVLSSRIERLEFDRKNEEVSEKDLSKKESLEAKIKNLKSNEDITTAVMDSENLKISECESQLKILIEKTSAIQISRLKSFDDSILEECTSRKATVTSTIAQLNDRLSKIAQGKCSECGRPYESKDKESLEEKREEAQATLIECNIKYENLKSEKADYEKKREANQDAKDLKTNLDNQITNKEAEIINLKNSAVTKVADAIRDQELTKSYLEESLTSEELRLEDWEGNKQKRLESLQESISLEVANKEANSIKKNNKEAEIQIIQTKISGIGDLNSFKDKVNNIEQEKRELTSSTTVFDNIVITNQEISKTNEGLKDKIEENQKEIGKLNISKQGYLSSLHELKETKTIMEKDFPNYVIESTVEGIEDDMTGFIEKVYWKSLDVSLRSTKTAIKFEYGTGKRKSPCKEASGAEKSLIQLAFLDSFNAEQSIKSMWLDEVDAPISNENKENLYDIIGSMMSAGAYEQIICVTHSPSMRIHMENNFNAQTIYL